MEGKRLAELLDGRGSGLVGDAVQQQLCPEKDSAIEELGRTLAAPDSPPIKVMPDALIPKRRHHRVLS